MDREMDGERITFFLFFLHGLVAVAAAHHRWGDASLLAFSRIVPIYVCDGCHSFVGCPKGKENARSTGSLHLCLGPRAGNPVQKTSHTTTDVPWLFSADRLKGMSFQRLRLCRGLLASRAIRPIFRVLEGDDWKEYVFFLLFNVSADMQWVHWLCIAPSIDEQPEFEDLRSRDVYDDGVLRRWFSKKKKKRSWFLPLVYIICFFLLSLVCVRCGQC